MRGNSCWDNLYGLPLLLDEGLYRCEGIDGEDGCTYYFTTQTEENSKSFVLYVQKEKGNCFFISSERTGSDRVCLLPASKVLDVITVQCNGLLR